MSDREKLVCKVCGLSYWWPGQAWKHENCKTVHEIRTKSEENLKRVLGEKMGRAVDRALEIAAPQAGQEPKTAPSDEGHAAGPAVAASIDPPQVKTATPPLVEPAGAVVNPEFQTPHSVTTDLMQHSTKPKFNRSEVMKQRWAARKAQGKTVL